ncbi:tripartite tricarboxylate transporter substrate binding protein [Hoeflea prorocentri]|uniref:Tripartite tricarboxylate transporter substrate binding protein n=1 Tax=Hoeflea prorocentri TaxID=1922333 RepID=A0A9X3ULQ1_9HYPH|nr:tripartite tricarboxylate transporter substrate binding protein [Hoeflea prorocentri]MCY6382871.1 tripartite tricarboxylate transporter substrate binding protein [Hoeflea prorocentri]MDA5400671.1 tripartite tricarboxylate transporter substrate binding protein [Hoeflea prorocentri]
MRFPKRTGLLAALMAAAITVTGTKVALAETWPEKSVTLVVPFRAGGLTDLVARKLEPGLTEELGQEIVVLNISGHSSVGTRRVVDAKPDGYEFLVHETGIMTAEASGIQDFGYRDLKPVAAVSSVCLVVVGKADSGWSSIKEIAAAKGDDPLIAGVTIGGASHMGVLKAAEIGGFEIRAVQVGGSADAYAALIGNQIDLMVTAPAGAKDYFYDEEGKKLEEPKATPLLYTGRNRHQSLPDIESMTDVGSGETICVPHMVFAPKDTPDAVVEKMAAALDVSYRQDGGLKDFFSNIGGTELFVYGAELPGFLNDNWTVLEPLAKLSKQ